MIKVIIFDLDDTLYSEIDYCKSGFSAVSDFIARNSQNISVDTIFDKLWYNFKNTNKKTIFNNTLENLSIPYNDEFIQKLVKTYRNHNPILELPKESLQVLNELDSNYLLALLTDGFLPAQQLKVKALGIENHFASIVYTEELGREFWKPSPAGFEKLICEFATKPQEMVYIADNAKKDFIAPNKLGIITIQLVRLNRIHKDPPAGSDAAPKHVIKQLKQLPQLLKNL